MDTNWRADIYVCRHCRGVDSASNSDSASKIMDLMQYAKSLTKQGIEVSVRGSRCFGESHVECMLVNLYPLKDSPKISGIDRIVYLTHRVLFDRFWNNPRLPEPVTQLIDELDSLKAGAVAPVQALEEAIMSELAQIPGHDQRHQYKLGQGINALGMGLEAPFIWNHEYHSYIAEHKTTGEIFFFSRNLKYIGKVLPTSEFTDNYHGGKSRIYRSREANSELEGHFFWDHGRVNMLYHIQQHPDGSTSRFYGIQTVNGNCKDILVYKITGNRLINVPLEILSDSKGPYSVYSGPYSQWTQSNEFVWRDVEILPKSGLYFVVYKMNFDKNGGKVDEEGRVVKVEKWKPISVKVVRKNRKRKFSLHHEEENEDSRKMFQELVPESMR